MSSMTDGDHLTRRVIGHVVDEDPIEAPHADTGIA
jgi:hypothetical protein